MLSTSPFLLLRVKSQRHISKEVCAMRSHHPGSYTCDPVYVTLCCRNSVQEAVGEPDIKAAHEKKWHDAVQRSFGQVRDRRLAEASQQVEAAINNMNMRMQSVLSDGNKNSAAICQALGDLIKDFNASTAGPTKSQRLVEFLQANMDVRRRGACLYPARALLLL